MHKDIGLVGVEVARRPKYQLIASILYLLNFWYRKIERRTELFLDLERPVLPTPGSQEESQGEEEYERVLDILVGSL